MVEERPIAVNARASPQPSPSASARRGGARKAGETGGALLLRLDRVRVDPENAEVSRFCLSLGSNVGDRLRALEEAVVRLRDAGLPIDRLSSAWETQPVGDAAGPDWFLNAAASGETSLTPVQVLEICRSVEQAMGRERTVPGGPRRIDVDLLLLGDARVSRPDCEVPHPRMHARRFVLAPLCEIEPSAVHPVLGLTVERLLERVDDPHQARVHGPLTLPGHEWLAIPS
jgi:2-amino-4-hydroxy-6-hydroxymethyldihydropteridine diphosphokinase